MNEPIPLRMTAAVALRIVRNRAKTTGQVIITNHAQQRMEERSLNIDDVFLILRRGGIYLAPIKNEKSEWQAEVERRMPGGREAVVIVVVPQGPNLIVRTVMWRDDR